MAHGQQFLDDGGPMRYRVSVVAGRRWVCSGQVEMGPKMRAVGKVHSLGGER
jgi:hypothetical protein